MPREESVNSTIGDKLWQKLWRRLCEWAAGPTVVEDTDAVRYPLLAGEQMQAKMVLVPGVISKPYKR
jgi:hypothetical protein